jgi:hypothetical protein
VAGLSQEGATVLETAVGFHFPRPASHWITARSFAAGDSPSEGVVTAEGSAPAWRFRTVRARRSTSRSCSPQHLHERVLYQSTSRASRE